MPIKITISPGIYAKGRTDRITPRPYRGVRIGINIRTARVGIDQPQGPVFQNTMQIDPSILDNVIVIDIIHNKHDHLPLVGRAGSSRADK